MTEKESSIPDPSIVAVTIIIPVYKTPEPYLRCCIESAMAQTLKNIEIILVNDGSPDECPHICDDYAKNDKRIQVIHQKNQGVSVARNRGLQAARGHFVTFVDADDWCEPQMCEKIFAYATENNSEVLIFSAIQEARRIKFYHIWPSNMPLFTKAQKDSLIETCILPHNFNDGIIISTWSKVYKREFLLQNVLQYPPGVHFGQDNVFNLQCILKASRIAYLNSCLYHYRQQENNQTTSRYHPHFHKETELLLSHLSLILKKENLCSKYERFISTRAIALILGHVLPQEFFHPDNPQPLKAILKDLAEFLRSPYSNSFSRSYKSSYFSLSQKIGICLCRHKCTAIFRLVWLKWSIQRQLGLWRW